MPRRTNEEYIEIHNRKKAYQNSLNRFKKNKIISKSNKDLLLKFLRDCELGKTLKGRAKKKISPARLVRLLEFLRNVSIWLGKDFRKVTTRNMEDMILDLENDKIRKMNGEPYSYETKLSYKAAIKKLYRWLFGEGKKFTDLVSWIETYEVPKEIPSLKRGEVDKLASRAGDLKYKVAIMCLFDSGARIEEFLNVRLKHLEKKDGYYMMRIVYSKTKPRTISLPMCTELLDDWLEVHPDGKNKNAPLIDMKYSAIRLFLRRHGKNIIGQPVTPHLLRHSSASYYCNLLTQYKLCYRYGWSMASRMPARYIDREGIYEKETIKNVKQNDMAVMRENQKKAEEEIIRLKSDLAVLNNLMPQVKEVIENYKQHQGDKKIIAA